MKGFISSNQSFVIVFGAVLFLIVLYFIFKSLPTKVVKKQAKESEKKSDSSKKEEIKEPEKKEDIEPAKEISEESVNEKKKDKKPKIVQVYKRESRNVSSDGESKKSHDPIYDRNVEFVNTSKNIAKFKSFADESKTEILEEEKTDDFGFVQDVQEDCDFCEVKVKHFDHSRRLSKAIREDDFDNMFQSHISEKYLNINSDKHLNLNEDFQKKLFDRTEKMLSNSNAKVSNDEHEKKSFSLFSDNSLVVDDSFEDDEDEVKINMKTALLADTFLGKKKRK